MAVRFHALFFISSSSLLLTHYYLFSDCTRPLKSHSPPRVIRDILLCNAHGEVGSSALSRSAAEESGWLSFLSSCMTRREYFCHLRISAVAGGWSSPMSGVPDTQVELLAIINGRHEAATMEIKGHMEKPRKSTTMAAWEVNDYRLIVSLSDIGFDDLHACADPGAPEHGYKTPSAGVFFESVVVRFHCQEGYRLNGTSKKLCVRHFNGSLSWKPSDKPVCLQEGKSVSLKQFTSLSSSHLSMYHVCVSWHKTHKTGVHFTVSYLIHTVVSHPSHL